jgi:hypothetical protein
MNHYFFTKVIGGLALLALASTPAMAQNRRGTLEGYQETPLTLSSPGTGSCRAKVNKDKTAIAVTLEYSDLTNVQQAHIHFGQIGLSGGVVLFFCSNLGNGPTGTPSCPDASATITRTLSATDVVGGAAGQGIAAGDLDSVIEALRNNVTYCNVHTAQFPGGEIRTQLQ